MPFSSFVIGVTFSEFKIPCCILYTDGTSLPTSSDHVVDSNNIFIDDVAVVIFHTHLCISCRCILNNNETKCVISLLIVRVLSPMEKQVKNDITELHYMAIACASSCYNAHSNWLILRPVTPAGRLRVCKGKK